MSLLNKIVIYGSLRMVYPLLSYLADDWGLTRTEIGYILGLSEIGGIPAGFLATLGDIYGTRRVGLLSYSLFIVASFLMLVPPTFVGLAVIRVLLMTTGTLYAIVSTTAMLQEHVGKGAGWITGISETGWALCSFTLLPILALIYEIFDWRAPFVVVALFTTLLLPEVYVDFPKHDVTPHTSSRGENSSSSRSKRSLWGKFKRSHYVEVMCMPGPVLFAVSGFFFSMAHNLTYIIFVNWAVDVHGLHADDMGGATFAIGAAEIIGAVLVVLFADRIGLYWSIYLCNISFFVGLIVFSLYGQFAAGAGIAGGVAIISIVMLPGQFSLVAQVAAMDDLVGPRLLSTAMGLNFQLFFAGRAVGAVIADPIWVSGGLVWSGVLDAVCILISLILLKLAEPYLITKGSENSETSTSDIEEQPALESQSSFKSGSSYEVPVSTDDVSESSDQVAHIDVKVEVNIDTGSHEGKQEVDIQ